MTKDFTKNGFRYRFVPENNNIENSGKNITEESAEKGLLAAAGERHIEIVDEKSHIATYNGDGTWTVKCGECGHEKILESKDKTDEK